MPQGIEEMHQKKLYSSYLCQFAFRYTNLNALLCKTGLCQGVQE